MIDNYDLEELKMASNNFVKSSNCNMFICYVKHNQVKFIADKRIHDVIMTNVHVFSSIEEIIKKENFEGLQFTSNVNSFSLSNENTKESSKSKVKFTLPQPSADMKWTAKPIQSLLSKIWKTLGYGKSGHKYGSEENEPEWWNSDIIGLKWKSYTVGPSYHSLYVNKSIIELIYIWNNKPGQSAESDIETVTTSPADIFSEPSSSKKDNITAVIDHELGSEEEENSIAMEKETEISSFPIEPCEGGIDNIEPIDKVKEKTDEVKEKTDEIIEKTDEGIINNKTFQKRKNHRIKDKKYRKKENSLNLDAILGKPEEKTAMDIELDEADHRIKQKDKEHNAEMDQLDNDIVKEKANKVKLMQFRKENAKLRNKLEANLDKETIVMLFHKNIGYFEKIRKGEEHSERHQNYSKGGRSRHALRWSIIEDPFTELQVNWVWQEVVLLWMRDDEERRNMYDYVSKVLINEILIKIFSEFFN